eukprot:1220625-Prymnesium_polylepis.1
MSIHAMPTAVTSSTSAGVSRRRPAKRHSACISRSKQSSTHATTNASRSGMSAGTIGVALKHSSAVSTTLAS